MARVWIAAALGIVIALPLAWRRRWGGVRLFLAAVLVFILALYASGIPPIELLASGGGVLLLVLVGGLFALTSAMYSLRNSD